MAHHIFCNKFMAPEEGCEMCKGLREKYPEDLPPDELVAKYFPSVKVRHLTQLAPDGAVCPAHQTYFEEDGTCAIAGCKETRPAGKA